MSPDSRLKRLALGTASIFLLIVGTLLNVPQMYLMAVALSLIPLVYWFIGLFLQRGVICHRQMPSSCERGERVKIDLVLRNDSILPKFYLRALDRLPRWVRFDGGVDDDGSTLLHLAPHESAKVSYFVRPFKRGQQKIGPTKLTNPDLIGLSAYSRIINQADDILVFPEVVPVNSQFFTGGAAHGWRDQENASTRGIGTDFQGVREYQTGDELRRVNWKMTARTGTLAVTEYALGYANDMTIAFDISQESYGEDADQLKSAFEIAIEIVASLAVSGLNQGSSVEIISNGDLPSLDAPMRGAENARIILTALAIVKPAKCRPLAEVVFGQAISANQDRSLIVVTGISPFDAGLNGALEHYRRMRGGAAPLVFWLDNASFESRDVFSFESFKDRKQGPAAVYESAVGKNIVIRPESDLPQLFSKAIL